MKRLIALLTVAAFLATSGLAVAQDAKKETKEVKKTEQTHKTVKKAKKSCESCADKDKCTDAKKVEKKDEKK